MIIYLAIMTLSAQPAVAWFWFFWQFFPITLSLTFFILFPLIFIIGVMILILSAAIVSRMFLSIVNVMHEPKEGVFYRNSKDKEYCYWSLRSVIRKWPIWIARQLNVPFFEKLVMKILGVKMAWNSCLNQGWCDCEFLEIGKNVRLGQGSIIMSNIIVKDKLIIKNVVIKDNVIIGAHSVIAPGTVIGEDTIVDALTFTKVNQKLDSKSTYSGLHARKIAENHQYTNKEKIEGDIFNIPINERFDPEILRTKPHELSVPFLFYAISGWLIIGCSFIVPALLFILYVFGFLVPNFLSVSFSLTLLLNLDTIITMLFIPLIFIGIYLLHLFFIVLIASWFYKYVDYRGPEQGMFDRNLDDSGSNVLDYYHARSFLLKYPVFAVFRSPFPWLIKWELRFIGSNKIGKGTVMEEGAYIHSHINYGKNCYVGTFAHISNHLVDGVYGEENLSFFGAEIEDGSVFSGLIGGLPGLKVGSNSTMLPGCSSIKFDKLGNEGIYSGFPARRLNKEQIEDVFGGEIHDE